MASGMPGPTVTSPGLGVFVPDLDWREALHAVVRDGVAFADGALDRAFRGRLQREVAGGPFAPAPSQVGPVLQQVEAYDVPDPLEGFPAVASLRATLVDRIRAAGVPALARWWPNVATVQRYRPGSLGITPHLDGKRHALLVAVVTAEGAAVFSVHRTREGKPVATFQAGPGSLVLLRGPGLAGEDGRPFHSVTGPREGHRLSVALRMDTRLVAPGRSPPPDPGGPGNPPSPDPGTWGPAAP
jgi:hypothetical protein